jgi:hypothetical protein
MFTESEEQFKTPFRKLKTVKGERFNIFGDVSVPETRRALWDRLLSVTLSLSNVDCQTIFHHQKINVKLNTFLYSHQPDIFFIEIRSPFLWQIEFSTALFFLLHIFLFSRGTFQSEFSSHSFNRQTDRQLSCNKQQQTTSHLNPLPLICDVKLCNLSV